MNVIIFPNEIGGVAIMQPNFDLVTDLMNDNSITKLEAITLIANQDVPVVLTQSGIIENINFIVGNRVTKSLADIAGLTYDFLSYEIVDYDSLPHDQPRESWEWV